MKNNLFYLVLIALISLQLASCGGDDTDPSEEMQEEEMMQNEEEGEMNNDELTLLTPCNYSISFGNEQLIEDASDGEPYCSTNSSNTSNASGRIVISGASLTDFNNDDGLSFFKGSMPVPTSISIPTDAAFEANFTPGTYDYAIEADGGVEIVYKDVTGVRWSSSNGDQTNSTFEILEAISGTVQSSFVVTIRAQYECMLYTEADNVKASRGTFVLSFENF